MSFRDKFGRNDPDLGSPFHDQMMIWLDGVLRSGNMRPFRPSDLHDGGKLVDIAWEVPLPLGVEGVLPSAFADILAIFSFEEPGVEKRRLRLFGFEVKPSIRSIGELLRQLNTYEVLAPTIDGWIVVSEPNATIEEIVRREGFGWADYTGPEGESA